MDSIKNVAKAVLKFQEKSRAIGTDATNPFYKSKYVTLDKVWDSIRADLQSVGLAVVQNPIAEDNKVGVETMIIHVESGETLTSRLLLPMSKIDAQNGGACITYARRFSLCPMLGLTVDIDDDGNTASDINTEEKFPTNPNAKESTETQKPQATQTDDYAVCIKCQKGVTKNVAEFSESKYKKVLCYNCQKSEGK